MTASVPEPSQFRDARQTTAPEPTYADAVPGLRGEVGEPARRLHVVVSTAKHAVSAARMVTRHIVSAAKTVAKHVVGVTKVAAKHVTPAAGGVARVLSAARLCRVSRTGGKNSR